MSNNTKRRTGMIDLEELERLTNPQTFKSDVDLSAIPKFNKYGDNIDPIIRKISIHNIDEYAFNPRQADNDHFETIKDSIQKIGLQQRFSVVKNPETKRYTLIKGGNTRLLAFKKLYRETSDIKFSSINCIVEPWDGELNKTQAVIAHLIENEARGELILVDKAKALIELEQEYKNCGIESLRTPQTKLEKSNISTTTQEFVGYLKDNGYSVSEGQLGLFRFTATKLTGNLDNFLNQGLGSPQIIKIRSVFNNLKHIVKDIEIEDYGLESLDSDFSVALKKYNKTRKPFDFEKLLDSISNYFITIEPFSTFFDNEVVSFRKELLSTTRKAKPVKIEQIKEESDQNHQREEVGTTDIADKLEANNLERESEDSSDSQNNNISIGQDNQQDSHQQQIVLDKPINKDLTEGSHESELTVSLELCRKQAAALSIKITSKFNISGLIERINTGCGFLLIDLIDKSKNDFEHWGIWWLLLGYSHASDLLNPISDLRSLGVIDAVLNQELSDLYVNINQSNANAVESSFEAINNKSEMYEFRAPNLQSVKDRLPSSIWQDITELESLCYQIMRIVTIEESEMTLWD